MRRSKPRYKVRFRRKYGRWKMRKLNLMEFKPLRAQLKNLVLLENKIQSLQRDLIDAERRWNRLHAIVTGAGTYKGKPDGRKDWEDFCKLRRVDPGYQFADVILEVFDELRERQEDEEEEG